MLRLTSAFTGFIRLSAMHSSIVNVIGHDSSSGKNYAMGVTSEDTPFYMEVLSAQSVRVITEADWNAVKSGCVLPTVIPMYPAHGYPLYQLTGTSKTVGTITYVGKIIIRCYISYDEKHNNRVHVIIPCTIIPTPYTLTPLTILPYHVDYNAI